MEALKLARRYQVIDPLGSGGFGQTFKARDLYLPGNPLCVVKQLKPVVRDKATLATAKRLFDSEAETLYQLGSHSQIPGLLAHFEEENQFYLVQEFIDGEPLDQIIGRGKKLSETYVRQLLEDILQVLAFVHNHGVIHRDIKPANLMRRNQDNKIVLIDFGAVKQVHHQAANYHGQSQLTVAIGSPGYMPKEQLRGQPRFSSDVYAVGMIGLEALSGLFPKDLPTDSRTGEVCVVECQKVVAIEPDFAAILARMISDDFSHRYTTAQEALQAIAQLNAQLQQQADQDQTVFTPLSSPLQTQATVVNTTPAQTEKTELAASGSQTDKKKQKSASNLDNDFLSLCHQELAQFIGPFAQFMIEDALAINPQLTRQELIEILMEEIPNHQQAQEFQRRLKQ